MNLGAEPKKLAILGTLVVVGGYVFYANVLSSEDPRPAARTAAKTAAPAAAAASAARPAVAAKGPNVRRNARPVRGAASDEFRPSLVRRPDDETDYSTLDPTLKLDLLAKVLAVAPEGGSRSLFQFATAPAPKPVADAPKIQVARRRIGPEPPPPPPPPPAPKVDPPPPPITLKFFGFSKPRPDGKRAAFFLDGEEVFVAGEGEMVKNRYRVVRIEANSVVMEDTQFKNNRQTLALQPEQQG